ncbi:hypothetical protein [Mycobacterium attenuatum]|uniref:hypothetical protein n=1 Tax=Mycobacterium attenuatum TaxID=2341086 RepID=UPI000F044393|nr:hypothetical protein [Mycobacterium attenuatum]VBA58544.1 hypothetical protein LAUMK41_03021 [Mycobacterium attenuatum]
MLNRIVLKRWWVRALASAGVYAMALVTDWCVRGLVTGRFQPWLFTPFTGACIVVFGVAAAALTSASHRVYADALAGLDAAQRSAAIDASVRGPVPADPRVRGAAAGITARRVYSFAHWRPSSRVLVVLMAVVAALGRYCIRGHPVGTSRTGSGWPPCWPRQFRPGACQPTPRTASTCSNKRRCDV